MLIDIIVLSIIAVLCGAESWNSIELFGNSKKNFLSKILRQHWGVENSLHWTLDVTFREDAQRGIRFSDFRKSHPCDFCTML
jgi:predicted transposase YbfD/YdcC